MKILPIKTGSHGNLYTLTTEENNRYLIECGLPKKQIITSLMNLNLGINDFKGCFVSHSHRDHCEAMRFVADYMPIFSNQGLKEKFDRVVKLPPVKVYEIDDLKVIPFHVEHGEIENYGYMFKDKLDTILFVTDFTNFNANIFNILFTEIYIECNWTKNLIEDYINEIKENRQINTHCSIDIVMLILNRLNLSKCRKITLIHPSEDYCDKRQCLEKVKSAFPNIDVSFANNLI